MNDGNRYWFPRKTIGWGWGLPVAWQGWVVLVAYLSGVAYLVFRATTDPAFQAFELYLAGSTVAVLLVCWAKGEPLDGQWGGK